MTIRLNGVDVDQTRNLLGEILRRINDDQRVMFLTKPGEGEAVIQRVRVMLSRTRKSLERKGRPYKHFRFHHSIHSHTEADGSRHDAVVVWRSRNIRHELQENLEDLMSHDESRSAA